MGINILQMANNALRVHKLCFALYRLATITEERSLPRGTIKTTRMRRTTQSGRINKPTASDGDSTAIICPYITKTISTDFLQFRRNIWVKKKLIEDFVELILINRIRFY
jgi:hypothetical protein